MKVLFLTPWYPSDKDAMLGLFVQKHAEAVRAQGVEVKVLFSQTLPDMWRQWRAIRREGWLPDLVQLNVIQKQGLLALWLKKRYGIPYIIVEHWSGYLPENGQYVHMPAVKKRFMQRVCRSAEQVLPVSLPLQRAMQDNGLTARRWGTIDNIVEDCFFEPSAKSQDSRVKTLLHVSCFDERAKNVKGLLRAAKMLSVKRQDWRLVLIGTGVDYPDTRAYADTLALPKGILEWTGELPPEEVARWMRQADALVLSSRYETYGVVLAEAYAAGLPILSTPVGIAEQTGALLVSQEIAQHKPGLFAEFMETILWKPSAVCRQNTDAKPFSGESVGKKLKEIYEQTLARE